MTLPDWIQWDKSRGYYTLIQAVKCQRCFKEWYPRIDEDGNLKLKICPFCKSKLWNKPKETTE